jgi:hypothetical protein
MHFPTEAGGREISMVRALYLAFIVLGLATACASNPHKAKKVDTKIENGQAVSEGEQVGVKDGNMVVQKKVAMNEELRKLQYEVFEMEDRVYGNRKFGSKGLYGALKSCREELVSKKWGGNGKLMWTGPADRVTEKESEFNIGMDEQDKIVGVSEEFLKDRIARFMKYRQTLSKRQDEYEEKLEICDADLKAKKENAGHPSAASE